MADEKEILIKVGADVSSANSGLKEVQDGMKSISDTPVDKPFKSLKAAIREATVELQKVEDQFGKTSKQFAEAAKKVSELKDRQQELNNSIAAFNPDNKLQALVSVAKGATGALQGVSGAMAFIGVESEKSSETLARLQGLMAFSQALNSVDDIKNAMKDFGNVTGVTAAAQKYMATATTVTSVALKALGFSAETTSVGFKVLRGAIIGTGIGALVIGLVALVQNFDSVKKAVLNLIPGLGQVADFLGGVINAITDFVGVTSEAEREMQKLIEATEKQIKQTDEFLDANGYKYDEYTQRKIKANNDYRKHLVEVNKDETKSEAEKQALLKQYRDKADYEINKAQSDREKKIADDNKKAKDELDKAEKEKQQKAKEARDKEKAARQKAAEEYKKQQENILEQDRQTSKLITEARLAAITDEFTKKQNQLQVSAQEELDKELDTLNKKLISYTQFEIRRKAIQDKYAQLQSDLAVEKAKQDEEAVLKAQQEVHDSLVAAFAEKKTVAETEVIKTTRENVVTKEDSPDEAKEKIERVLEAKLEAEQAAFELEKVQKAGQKAELEQLEQQHLSNVVALTKQASDDKKAIDDAETEAKKNNIQAVSTFLGNLSELAGKQTVAGKALAIAQTTIDTYQAAMSAYKSMAGIPVVGPALGVAAAAAAVAAGIKNVQKIVAVQVPGNHGGNGSSAPAIANAPSINSTQLSPEQIGKIQDVRVINQQDQVVKAFVSQRDLDTQAEKSAFLNKVRSL